MKLSKFLILVLLFTSFSLLYVWQQTEIFRLAYIGQSNVTAFQDLLDKNAALRYNINKNFSLVRIGSKVEQDLDFQMPESYRLVKVAYTKENLRLIRQSVKRESIAFRIFGIKRQAEAKTINP